MSAIGVTSEDVYRHSFFKFAANLDIKPQKNICTINHEKNNLSKNHKKQFVCSLINIRYFTKPPIQYNYKKESKSKI